MDLIIITLLTLAAIPVVGFTDGIPRIILAVVFILIFPGYTLVAALFPNKKSLRGIERAALTIVLSFALVSLTGLALNSTPWGIRLTPIFAAIAVIIFLDSGIALLRRRRLREAERFELRIKFQMPKWRGVNWFDRALYIVLTVAVIGTISTMAYVTAKPKAGEAFTNLYILGPEGTASDYPLELALGEPVRVTLVIENHENQAISYKIAVILDGEEIQGISPIQLPNGEKWRQEVTFVPLQAGENQRAEFVLYKGEESEPYLALHLWLNVKA